MSFERLAPSLHVRNELLGFVRYIAPEILQDAGYEGFPVDVRPLSFLRVGIAFWEQLMVHGGCLVHPERYGVQELPCMQWFVGAFPLRRCS